LGKKAKHDPALFTQAKNPKKHCNPKEQLLANKAKRAAAGKVRKGLSVCHKCVSHKCSPIRTRIDRQKASCSLLVVGLPDMRENLARSSKIDFVLEMTIVTKVTFK